MVKKHKAVKTHRELTRRQLSHWQQQKRRQRIILSAGTFAIAATVVLMLLGLYFGQYQPLHQTAIRVNDTKFDMQYFIDMLKLNEGGQGADYLQGIAGSVAKTIEQNEVVRQGALKLGISVSDDEVRQELKNSSLPNTHVYRDLVTNQLLVNKLLDEYFDPQVPQSAEQRQVMAMLLESESQAADVRARLEVSENFTDLAGELSLESYTKFNKGNLGWHPENIFADILPDSKVADYAFSSEVGVLSQPVHDEEIVKNVGYWLIKVLDREDQEAHVQAMLLGSDVEAQEIMGRLETGDNFTALAKEFSQLNGADTNEGDLGLVAEGDLTTAFDEFVFNTDIKTGTLSEIIRDEAATTKGGYWLIDVLNGEDDRQIDSNDRDWLKRKALNEWGLLLLKDPTTQIDDTYLDSDKISWAVEQAMKALPARGG